MKNLKWPLITSASTSLGIALYLFFVKQSFTFQTLSDTFFIVSLFFLIVGIALWIMSSGFFDTFQRTMKNAFRFRKKNDPQEFTPLSIIGKDHRLFWLETGGILLIIALCFLLFYFL